MQPFMREALPWLHTLVVGPGLSKDRRTLALTKRIVQLAKELDLTLVRLTSAISVYEITQFSLHLQFLFCYSIILDANALLLLGDDLALMRGYHK